MSWAHHFKGRAQSSPFPALPFPEVDEAPIHCWVGSEFCSR